MAGDTMIGLTWSEAVLGAFGFQNTLMEFYRLLILLRPFFHHSLFFSFLLSLPTQFNFSIFQFLSSTSIFSSFQFFLSLYPLILTVSLPQIVFTFLSLYRGVAWRGVGFDSWILGASLSLSFFFLFKYFQAKMLLYT